MTIALLVLHSYPPVSLCSCHCHGHLEHYPHQIHCEHHHHSHCYSQCYHHSDITSIMVLYCQLL